MSSNIRRTSARSSAVDTPGVAVAVPPSTLSNAVLIESDLARCSTGRAGAGAGGGDMTMVGSLNLTVGSTTVFGAAGFAARDARARGAAACGGGSAGGGVGSGAGVGAGGFERGVAQLTAHIQ